MGGMKSSTLIDLRMPGHFGQVTKHKKENFPDSAAAITLGLKVI